MEDELMRLRILIIDSDSYLYTETKSYLLSIGYEVKIVDSSEILDQIDLDDFDLILTEIELPFIDGWELCKALQQKTEAPIMIISTRSSVQDKVLGFSLGAEDYLSKPFDKQELWARIEVLLKRRNHTSQQIEALSNIHLNELSILQMAREVRVRDKKLRLTPKEFDLLLLLAGNPGKVLERKGLIKKIWGEDFKGSVRTVDSHVKNLREKLQKSSWESSRIETIWNIGYKFLK